MEYPQNSIRFRKPEFDLVTLFGLLIAIVLTAAWPVLVLLYSAQLQPKLFASLSIGLLVYFAYIVIRSLGRSRYVYFEDGIIRTHYRVSLKKDSLVKISDCEYFFPFQYEYSSRRSSGYICGVILALPDKTKLTLRMESYKDHLPERVQKLITMLKDNNVSNLNTKADYSITLPAFFAFDFRNAEVQALEQTLAYNEALQKPRF